MLKHFFWVLFSVMALNTSAQRYVSERGVITFFSEAAIENIEATNSKVTSLFNSSSLEIAFSVPIREFQFDKKLMQQHFNEKYMESDKFPKSTFSGKVEGFIKDKNGLQSVKANGILTIHGVSKTVEIPGTIEITNQSLVVRSKFIIKLVDFNIKIPQLMWQNIAEQIEVKVEFTYKLQ